MISWKISIKVLVDHIWLEGVIGFMNIWNQIKSTKFWHNKAINQQNNGNKEWKKNKPTQNLHGFQSRDLLTWGFGFYPLRFLSSEILTMKCCILTMEVENEETLQEFP